MSKQRRRWKLTKFDVLIFAGIILLFAGSLFWTIAYFSDSALGAYVRVCSEGEPAERYPLREDREIRIQSANGENVLRIKDGQAFISYADCPDQYCVEHKPIGKSKESIVCLPNQLVITIEGGEAWELDDVAN